jgi:hypothetical protein
VLSEKQKNVQELQRTQVTNFSVDALAHIPWTELGLYVDHQQQINKKS